MHEVLVDQLPPLSEMRRCLEELTLMETPPASSSPFVIEQVSEMRTEIEKCCDAQGGFKKIAEKQLRSHFSMSAEDRRADVMRMAALYEGLNLEELSAGSKGASLPAPGLLLTACWCCAPRALDEDARARCGC